MPIDPRIPLMGQPAQIASPLEAYSQVAQIQAVREQTEARRQAAEERRAAAQEAAAKRARQEAVEAALQSAVTVGPDGQPAVDYQKLLGHLPATALLEVKQKVDEIQKTAVDLASSNLTLEDKKRTYNGALAHGVKASNYDPKVFALAVTAGRKAGTLTPTEADAGLALLEQPDAPDQIRRMTDAAIAQAGGKPELEKVTTVDEAGNTVEKFVTPTEGATYVQPTKTTPVSYQAKDVLLDGRPALVSFNSQAGTYHLGGQDVTARVRPIPPQGPGPEPLMSVVGPDGKPVYVTRSQALGKTPGSAAGDGGGVKLTGAQQEDIATMMTVQELATEAGALGKKTNWTGVGPVEGRIGGTFVGYGGAEGETLRNLVGNIQGTIAKLRGGTAFSEAEKAMLETYTPTTTDTAAKIQAKLKSLASFIEKKRTNTLRVASGQYTVPAAGASPPPPPAAGAPAKANPFRK